MGYCDICNAVGRWDTVSANNFQKAINNGFNPVKLGLLEFDNVYTPESWKTFAQSPMASGSAWALCNKYMPKIKPYLNEKFSTQEDNKKEGCFIATACYGDYNANEVLVLRKFRDEILLKFQMGKLFVSFYYAVSPPIAKFISKHIFLRKIVKTYIVNPITKVVSKQ